MRWIFVMLSGCPSPPPLSFPDASPARSSFALEPGVTNALTATLAVPYSVLDVSAAATIEGPFARTELSLAVEAGAAEPMPIELPPVADVLGVSVQRDDVWIDAPFLERSRQLLVPVRPGKTERIRVVYTELLERPIYRLPLATYGTIGSLSFTGSVRTATGSIAHTLSTLGHRGDVEVPSPISAVRAGDRAIIRYASRPQGYDPIESLLLLVDTSASRSTELPAVGALLRILIEGLVRERGDVPLLIAGFDQSVEVYFAGGAASVGEDFYRSMRPTKAMGATDLTLALVWIGSMPPTPPYRRALLITDGRTTAGFDDARTAEVAKGLASLGVQRLDVIALGHADRTILGRVALAFSRPGLVIDGTAPLEKVVESLETSPSTPKGATLERLSPGLVELRVTTEPIVIDGAPIDPITAASDLARTSGFDSVLPTLKGGPGEKPRRAKPPHSGAHAEIMRLIGEKKLEDAQALALEETRLRWADPLSWIGLGRVVAALHDSGVAGRAYGSILDLHPNDLALRRGAAMHLESLSERGAVVAGADALRRAAEQDPLHAPGLRLHAIARLKLGKEEEALAILEQALMMRATEPETAQAMRDDVALIGAAWVRREPQRKLEINARVARLGVLPKPVESLRFVLHWEGGGDVDLFVTDGKGNRIPPVIDDRDGHGPEQVVLSAKARQRSYPFRVAVQHGPLARPSFGKVEIIEHDGRGGYEMEELPFVVTESDGRVELDSLDGPVGSHH